jgi:uncharacterized protein (TIGR02996 family)
MPESADLLAAVAAAPADDLPRLVYADWLDDRGEPDYATFVRDQIRLSQVPSWDPLAVRARHQRKETLGIGRPFYGTLPDLPLFLKWHPEKAFRRGFGTGVVVNQLSGLIEAGQQLFDLAPVDELWLGAASLDEWRTVARSPWLRNIRKVHLHFSQSLHEPIRCLAESPYSGNIDEIWFDTLATPAAGAVIEILAQSPLARQLTGLHMRLVHTPSLPEVIAALAGGMFKRLERFSMVRAGLGHHQLVDLRSNPNLVSIKSLDLSGNPLQNIAFGPLFVFPDFSRIEILLLEDCSLSEMSIYKLATEQGIWLENLSSLSLADNRFGLGGLRILAKQKMAKLSHLSLNKCGITDQEFDFFIYKSRWFRKLVELQLSHNSHIFLSKYFIEKRVPKSLVSIELSRPLIANESLPLLQRRLGDRLIWAEDEAATGLAR